MEDRDGLVSGSAPVPTVGRGQTHLFSRSKREADRGQRVGGGQVFSSARQSWCRPELAEASGYLWRVGGSKLQLVYANDLAVAVLRARE